MSQLDSVPQDTLDLARELIPWATRGIPIRQLIHALYLAYYLHHRHNNVRASRAAGMTTAGFLQALRRIGVSPRVKRRAASSGVEGES